MAETTVWDWDLYKLPIDEILKNRIGFYEFKREVGEPIERWLIRIQNCISCCDYPPFIIEFLLIDRFICGLNKTEREVIRGAGTWSFKQIIGRFVHQKVDSESMDANLAIDNNVIPNQNIPVECVCVVITFERTFNIKMGNFYICISD